MKFIIHISFVLYMAQAIVASTLISKFREHQQLAANKELQHQPTAWSASVPHMLQDVLVSIDDKLRSLDTFSYTLKLARLDFSLEQLVRRLENIETKLSRMETKFDVRMEKVEEVVIGKDLKEEFSNEHMVRRMENLNDKFNTKTSFLDAKIDIRMDRIGNKLELLERDLQSATDDIIEKLGKTDERHLVFESDVSGKLNSIYERGKNELKVGTLHLTEEFERRLNEKLDRFQKENQNSATAKSIESNVQTTLDEIKQMYNSRSSQLSDSRFQSILDDYAVVNGQTQKQIEAIMNNLTTIIYKTLNLNEAKFKELNSDVELYTKKIINSMENLWKSSDEVKTHLYDAVQQGNRTREIVRQEFNKLHEQIMPLPMIEPKLADVSVNLNEKLSKLGTTVDNSFATLLIAQNTFIDTCRRIQHEESQIYEVLEKVVYEMRNRSKFDIENIVSNMRNHSDNMSKNLDDIIFAVLTASNETVNRILEFILSKQNLQVHSNGCPFSREADYEKMDEKIEAVAYNIPEGKVTLSINPSKDSDPDSFPENPLVDKLSGSKSNLKHFPQTGNTSLGLDYENDYQLQEENDYPD